MKKSLFLLGVAAAVFSGCSNQEVMDVAEYANQPIEFTTFVDKTTRSGDVLDSNFERFWAFAQFRASSESQGPWSDAFKGVQVNKTGQDAWVTEQTYYWSENDTYRFAAYADGKNSNDGVSYSADGNGKLTFDNYTAGENDLVAAFGSQNDYTWDGTSSNAVPSVALTFNHLLSKVTFTFKTKLSAAYTIQVSQLKVNAVKTTSGSYTKNGTPTWQTGDNVTKNDYTFKDITDVASGTQNEEGYFTQTGEALYLIPQSNEKLNATFTVSIWDASQTPATDTPLAQKEFTASLKYTAASSGDNAGTTNLWTPGFYYNYTGEITMENVDPEGNQKPITFTVTTVKGWTDAGGTTDELIKEE